MKKNPINLRIKLFQFVAIIVTGLIWYFSEDAEGIDYAAFPAMLVMGLAQTGLSAYDKFQAGQDIKDTTLALSAANKDLRELEYTNQLKSVSVPKNQVAMDQLGQQTTQIVDAAQESGQRGVLGASGKVNQLFDKGTMKVSQADQMKQFERDMAVAENEQNINNMNVNKDLQLGMQNIYGLQSALGYQQGQENNATNQMYSGIGTTIAGMGQLNAPTKTTNVNTTMDPKTGTPMGNSMGRLNPTMTYDDYLATTEVGALDVLSPGEFYNAQAIGVPGMQAGIGYGPMNTFNNPLANLASNNPQLGTGTGINNTMTQDEFMRLAALGLLNP
jgi:hypothetical protein